MMLTEKDLITISEGKEQQFTPRVLQGLLDHVKAYLIQKIKENGLPENMIDGIKQIHLNQMEAQAHLSHLIAYSYVKPAPTFIPFRINFKKEIERMLLIKYSPDDVMNLLIKMPPLIVEARRKDELIILEGCAVYYLTPDYIECEVVEC